MEEQSNVQQLSPELIEQIMSLSPEQKRQLAEVLIQSIQQEQVQQQAPQQQAVQPTSEQTTPMMKKGGKVESYTDFHRRVYGDKATKSIKTIEPNNKQKKR